MPDSMTSMSKQLSERIWNAFPVAQPAFGKLLALLEIEASREIPSACVTLGARSRMLLNPDFVAQHCAEDASLVMLVLHELYHVVLGHTRLWKCMTPAQNIAFDAVINAQLCQLFPGAEWTKLFRDCHDPRSLPAALLRPPEGWGGPSVAWLPGEVGALQRRLYSETSTSYEELFQFLSSTLEAGLSGEALRELLKGLLGSHGTEPDDIEAPDPGLLAEIRSIIARWPMVERRSGQDLGGIPRSFRIDLGDRRRGATSLLRKAMTHLGETDSGGTGRPRRVVMPTAVQVPHRSQADRRSAVLEVCGAEPLLHMGTGGLPFFQRGEQVHVYLDVSGSMHEVIAPLYAALVQLSSRMAPELHLFSTVVKDISLDALRRGIGLTTDGTSITAVTEHMVRHGVRRALVITDGWVGEVPSEHTRELAQRRGRFGVALTRGGCGRFASGLPQARLWNLPDLTQESR